MGNVVQTISSQFAMATINAEDVEIRALVMGNPDSVGTMEFVALETFVLLVIFRETVLYPLALLCIALLTNKKCNM